MRWRSHPEYATRTICVSLYVCSAFNAIYIYISKSGIDTQSNELVRADSHTHTHSPTLVNTADATAAKNSSFAGTHKISNAKKNHPHPRAVAASEPLNHHRSQPLVGMMYVYEIRAAMLCGGHDAQAISRKYKKKISTTHTPKRGWNIMWIYIFIHMYTLCSIYMHAILRRQNVGCESARTKRRDSENACGGRLVRKYLRPRL